MRKILLVCCMCLAMAWSVVAQDRAVTGKVTEQDGSSPLPGVNVIVKGTSVGTVTDVEGKYSLNVPSGSNVLVFSFIGLTTQEIDIASRTSVDIQMSTDVK